MKSTGIVRKIDELGRIVVPKELRGTLDIQIGDGLEIFVERDYIILRKYSPHCIYCGEAAGISYFKGKPICRNCLAELRKE
jgi:transcriptional pleiotropic regulator of transition state genes